MKRMGPAESLLKCLIRRTTVRKGKAEQLPAGYRLSGITPEFKRVIPGDLL